MSDHSGEGDWEEFFYQSDSWRTEKQHGRDCPIFYFHWLPSQQEELVPEQQEEEDLLDIYKEFDTLTHTTTMENAYLIFKYGFKPQPVSHNSVVNSSDDLMNADTETTITPRPLHPLRRSPVLWYGPNTFNKLEDPEFKVERYGNVLFSMKYLWGDQGLRREGGLRYYFVEVIKYQTSSACRILVTHEDYPELKPYDPYTRGGPLYFEKMTEYRYKFYYASEITWRDGTKVPNVLEIMKEESTSEKILLENHVISFFKCEKPRKNVVDTVVEPAVDPSTDLSLYVMSYLVPNILKLAIMLSFGKPLCQLKLLTPFDNQKLHVKLKEVHNGALQKLKEEKDKDVKEMIKLAFGDIVQSFMSKSDILLSYCDLLRVVSEPQRESLADEIWEEIQVDRTLADPKK